MDKTGKQPSQKDNSCQLCTISYSSKQELKEHFWSLIHHIQIEKTNKNMPHNCTVCFTSCSSLAEYGKHLNIEKHKTAVTEERKVAEERKNNNNPPPEPPPVPRKKTSGKDKLKPKSSGNPEEKDEFLLKNGDQRHEQSHSWYEDTDRGYYNNSWGRPLRFDNFRYGDRGNRGNRGNHQWKMGYNGYDRQNNYYGYRDYDFSQDFFPTGNNDGGEYSYDNPEWNNGGYEQAWWPSQDRGYMDWAHYNGNGAHNGQFGNPRSSANPTSATDHSRGGRPEGAQNADGAQNKEGKSSWNGQKGIQKAHAQESPASKGGKRSTPETTPTSQLAKRVKMVSLSSSGSRKKLLQPSPVKARTFSRKSSSPGAHSTGKQKSQLMSSRRSADLYRSRLNSPSQSPSRDFLKETPKASAETSGGNNAIIVDDGTNIQEYPMEMSDSSDSTGDHGKTGNSLNVNGGKSRFIQSDKINKESIMVKSCGVTGKKTMAFAKDSTLAERTVPQKSTGILEKAEALCKEVREKREITKIERKKKQELTASEEQEVLLDNQVEQKNKSALIANASGEGADVSLKQMPPTKTASGEISTRLSSAVAARTAEFCDPALNKTWSAASVLHGLAEDVITEKDITSVVCARASKFSVQINCNDTVNTQEKSTFPASSSLHGFAEEVAHKEKLSAACTSSGVLHGFAEDCIAQKNKSSVACTDASDTQKDKMSTTCASVSKSSQQSSGPGGFKKDPLFNLVNEPRSRKERHRLAAMLRKHSQSQSKRPVSVANLHLSGMYDDLPEPEGEVKLENLPSELQLKIADLIDGGGQLPDDHTASSDALNSEEDLKSLLSVQFTSLSDVSSILNRPMKTEPAVPDVQIQASSSPRSTSQTSNLDTTKTCRATKKPKSKIKKIPRRVRSDPPSESLTEETQSKISEGSNPLCSQQPRILDQNEQPNLQVPMTTVNLNDNDDMTGTTGDRGLQQQVGLDYVNRVLHISIREEELRKNVIAVNTRMDTLRKLIHNYTLQLGQCELQKNELLKQEETLRKERMKILKEAVTGSTGDNSAAPCISSGRQSSRNVDRLRYGVLQDEPVSQANFVDAMQTDYPLIKQEPMETETNSFFHQLTSSKELPVNGFSDAPVNGLRASDNQVVHTQPAVICSTSKKKTKKAKKLKKSAAKNVVEIDASELEVVKEKLGLSDVEPPSYCMQYMGTLKPGDDRETIISKLASTLIKSQKSSKNINRFNNGGNVETFPPGENNDINNLAGSQGNEFPENAISMVTQTLGLVLERDRIDGDATTRSDDPKSKEFFLSCLENSSCPADVNISLEQPPDVDSPTPGRTLKDCSIVLERLDLQADDGMSGATVRPKESNFRVEPDHGRSSGKTVKDSSTIMSPPISVDSPDPKKRLKTRKQRNQVLNGISSCIIDSSSDTNTQGEDSAGSKPWKKARWTGKKKAQRKHSKSPEKQALRAKLHVESSSDVEINGLDENRVVAGRARCEISTRILRERTAGIRGDNVEVKNSAVRTEILSLVGPAKPITSLQVFKGYLYVCYDGFQARKYDLEAGGSSHVQEYHSGTMHIHCLTVTNKSDQANMERVFLGGNAKTLVVFNAETGRKVGDYKFGDKIQCLHSRWGHLFIGLTNGGVMIFDLKKNKTLGAYRCSTAAISSISSTTEGVRKIICVASHDASIGVYDASSGMLLRALSGHSSVPCFIQTQDQILFSAGEDKKALMHNICSGDLQYQFCDAGEMLTCLTYVQMGNSPFLLTAGADKLIRCYNLEDKKLVQLYYGAGKSSIASMAILDGRIITASGEGAIEAILFQPESLLKCQHCKHVFGLKDHLHHHISTDHPTFWPHNTGDFDQTQYTVEPSQIN